MLNLLNNLAWRLIAFIVTRERVFLWLYERALRTPYRHLRSADGKDIYMGRWWLFNPYTEDGSKRWPWLPSIRLHHILRPDLDRHLHNHPWNARTIILRGRYEEERYHTIDNMCTRTYGTELRSVFNRNQGYTGRLLYREFHRISAVPDAGAITLFFTWTKQGKWGFDVDGETWEHEVYSQVYGSREM